jgi:hypothetical protein
MHDANFIAAQSKAQRVAQAHGDSAPSPVQGETLMQYRTRLLTPFQPHSPTWSRVRLSALAPDALSVAENAIYSDSLVAAHNPATVAEGTLREIVEADATGRRISRFIGHPEACWGPFKQPARLVTGWPGAQQQRTRS